MLPKNSFMNNQINSNGIFQVSTFSLLINSTEMKRIMDTASLTIPSPKTTLNNLGYFSGLIIVNAATLSEAHMVAEKIMIFSKLNFIIFLSKDSVIKPN